MPDSLYEHDALAWSEQQAALLRRMAAGERLNEAPDWANTVEEIEDFGRSELHACESNLERALEHLMELHGEPASPSAAHWRGEIATFPRAAQRRFSPTMRQRIDLADLYEGARFRLTVEAGADAHPGMPAAICP